MVCGVIKTMYQDLKNLGQSRFTWFIVIYSTVWVILAPGPKYEEMFMMGFLAEMLFLISTVTTLIKPAYLLIPILTSVSCLICWTVATLKVCWMYDYDLCDMVSALFTGLAISLVGFVYLFILSVIVIKVKQAISTRRERKRDTE